MVQRLDSGQVPSSEHIRIEPLGQNHDRAVFVCTKDNLTHYFNGTTSPPRTLDQDIKYGMANPFVMVDTRNEEVIGYFTLSTGSISKDTLSSKIASKLGYKDVPTMLLGRMAIAAHLEGKGLGKMLLLAALYKAYKMTDGGKGCYAVMLDAADDKLVEWYGKHGFKPVPTDEPSRRMVIPMLKIIDEISRNTK